MPSMWKKQKGNRISRLVADLKTNPTRGNHLVVETGFPTSIADILVKNHDKLKKSSKKKHRSKQLPPSPTTPSPDDQLLPAFHSRVSDSPVSLSKLDAPSCSNDVGNNQFVAQTIDSDSHAEENFAQKNPRVELNSGVCECDDAIREPEKSERVSNSKKAIWLMGLKGALIVTVAMFTRSFVLGISFGALLLCLVEYLGDSVLGFLKPCAVSGFLKPRRVGDEMIDNMTQEGSLKGEIDDIDLLRENGGENGDDSTKAMELKGQNVYPQKREIELVLGNDLVFGGDIEPQDGDGIALKGEIEQGNVTEILEAVESKLIDEIEVLEPDICNSVDDCSISSNLNGAKMALECGEGSKGTETLAHNGQGKKRKKFWKKLVPKKSKKNKNKHRNGLHTEEISPELEERNEQEIEQEMEGIVAESSFSSLLSFEEQEREGVEEIIGYDNSEMINSNNVTAKSSRITKKKSRDLRCLGILGIALAGLTGGRVFALVLTVISCILFKIVRG